MIQRILLAVPLAFCVSACVTHEPPGGDFRKVSDLVAFPDFYPGLGRLYVQPATMPMGPYYGYGRDGRLVCTIYMIPLRDLERHKRMEDLVQGAPLAVDHMQMLYTNGHPGVDEPHYHVILWHVTRREESYVR